MSNFISKVTKRNLTPLKQVKLKLVHIDFWSATKAGFLVSLALGIATIKLDGATIGTIDLYAAAPAAYDSTITGITVSTDGAQTLQVVMATKNASSSGYQGNASWFTMWRTA